MTALEKYQRLEAGAFWREGPEEERRAVVVSIGKATLTISDGNGQPLTHWSIGALTRANPGALPAIYHPGDPSETLEIPAAEGELIDCLQTLVGAVERRRPGRGRLRLAITLALVAGIVGAAAFWLPGALESQALKVLPRSKRAEISRTLMSDLRPVTGPACTAPGGAEALARLASRLEPAAQVPMELRVVRKGVRGTLALPGGVMLIDSAILENVEDPEAAAGIILSGMLRARARDPLAELMHASGTIAVIRLLTSGSLPASSLDAFARGMTNQSVTPLSASQLLPAFDAAGLQSRPFARTLPAADPRIEALVSGDPYPDGAPDPIMSDGDWLRLQQICID
ncbi:hypothetical protein KM176_01920 [Pseudooceanicola sp. CBS1P-1]|uniref:Uncharacterized protein n=1 Tax=Pseudooceanicola albus TaxID=2692189 RepID=A0A6L7FZE8_9RHOB|nr:MULTISPECIES: hypothetical protein [Pseudooceanicola]MBT9382604.1 hypothetical protein [Pseudooceanicola endophyticus]MXN17145.1 hypothetical protein [Pseudooceanicola albus]